MIETNAFLAMFAVLVLTIAVMHMLVLMRFVRTKTATMPDDYFAQMYPAVDRHESTERFISRYRLAHAAVALLGVLLLGWLVNYMQDPGWDKRWVLFPIVGYFMLQWLPMVFTAMTGIKHIKLLRNFLMQQRRKAMLERRGLSNFVSPVAVGLAALAWLLSIGLALYLTNQLAARLIFIGALTFHYALSAFTVYRALYGRRSDPFETHAGRLYTIGLRVRSTVYSCIAVALFMSFAMAAFTLGIDRWMPFALATFLTAMTFITFGVFIGRPRGPQADDLASEVAS